jgi:hypothetical protein
VAALAASVARPGRGDDAEPAAGATFRREGDYWTLAYRGELARSGTPRASAMRWRAVRDDEGATVSVQDKVDERTGTEELGHGTSSSNQVQYHACIQAAWQAAAP